MSGKSACGYLPDLDSLGVPQREVISHPGVGDGKPLAVSLESAPPGSSVSDDQIRTVLRRHL